MCTIQANGVSASVIRSPPSNSSSDKSSMATPPGRPGSTSLGNAGPPPPLVRRAPASRAAFWRSGCGRHPLSANRPRPTRDDGEDTAPSWSTGRGSRGPRPSMSVSSIHRQSSRRGNPCGCPRWGRHEACPYWHRTYEMDISHSTRRLANPGGRVRDAGSPGAQLLAWCHAGTGFVLEALAAPWHTHDMAEAQPSMPRDARGTGSWASVPSAPWPSWPSCASTGSMPAFVSRHGRGSMAPRLVPIPRPRRRQGPRACPAPGGSVSWGGQSNSSSGGSRCVCPRILQHGRRPSCALRSRRSSAGEHGAPGHPPPACGRRRCPWSPPASPATCRPPPPWPPSTERGGRASAICGTSHSRWASRCYTATASLGASRRGPSSRSSTPSAAWSCWPRRSGSVCPESGAAAWMSCGGSARRARANRCPPWSSSPTVRAAASRVPSNAGPNRLRCSQHHDGKPVTS
jgi:hypothetical protein